MGAGLIDGYRVLEGGVLIALDGVRDLILKARLKSDLFELGTRVLTCGGYFCILLLLFQALSDKLRGCYSSPLRFAYKTSRTGWGTARVLRHDKSNHSAR